MASYLSDVLPHVFNHHFISSNWLQSKETPVVDVRLAESDLFLTELDRGDSKEPSGEENVSDKHNKSCVCTLPSAG